MMFPFSVNLLNLFALRNNDIVLRTKNSMRFVPHQEKTSHSWEKFSVSISFTDTPILDVY